MEKSRADKEARRKHREQQGDEIVCKRQSHDRGSSCAHPHGPAQTTTSTARNTQAAVNAAGQSMDYTVPTWTAV